MWAALSLAVMACGTTSAGRSATSVPLSLADDSTHLAPTGQPSPNLTQVPMHTPAPAINPSPAREPAVTESKVPSAVSVTQVTPTAVPAESPTPAAIPTATPTPAPVPIPIPSVTPKPTSTPTPALTPTSSYVRPTGYDIFAPGGLKGNCESDPEPVFTAHITDLSLIDSLTPAGTVQGGDLKPHGYLGNKPWAKEVPVYAPVDSYLIDFAYYVQGSDAIFTFKFQVSYEVAYYFDHLRSVVSEIQELIVDAPTSNSHGTIVHPPLFFRAGDLIGYTGGTSMSQIWDFGVLNTQAWNDLPPEETYTYSPNVEKYRFAVCQYEYFPEDIRRHYMAMLGSQGCGP